MGINGVVSVIVPVYNTAPWLRRCLDSICAQSFRNLEILCVNDGSTDNSAEILAEYAAKDARIKVFTQENAGLSAARNTALEHATGEWVTGVDSDDYLAAGVYEHAMNCAAAKVDMIFFEVQEVTEAGTPLPHNGYFELPEAGQHAITPELAEKLNVCFCSKLWRRSVIEENALRFPVGLLHEDYAMYYLFTPHANKISISATGCYFYVQRSGSIVHSGQQKLETARRYILVLRFIYEQYKHSRIEKIISIWFLSAAYRLYETCYHDFDESEYCTLSELFCAMLNEVKLLPSVVHDYRFRCMVQPRGWHKLFLSRYLNTELYRFLGMPVWQVNYTHGERNNSRFILSDWLLAKCRKILSRA